MKVASLFQEHMILQQGKVVPVWGEAEAGEGIRIVVQGNCYDAKADQRGHWIAWIGPLDAQESGTMEIIAGDERVIFCDLAVGEVYLAGGQSNMEFLMRYEKHFGEECKQCDNSAIRFYDIPEVAYDGQEQDFDYSKVGIWRRANRENLDYFSAPAYYFAKKLQKELGIPVGIIGLNWGGTRSSAWMTEAHAREICPEQAADFEAKLQGKGYEKIVAEAGKNRMNDRGYSVWNAFDELIMRQPPAPEEVSAFFAEMGKEELPDLKHYPGTLYEHMVKRAAPFGVRGVLWYQGESDDELEGSAAHYAQSLKTVIGDWRALWREELPFFVVQLPGFGSWLHIVNRQYSMIRQAQQQVADEDESVFLCSISDLGDEFDIHPKNKREVGQRLALLALCHIYGRTLLADPPKVDAVSRNGNHVTIRFANAGAGLTIRGDSVSALFVKAGERELTIRSTVQGDCLELLVDEADDKALTVSFAEGDWYVVNLFSSVGIPAIPFELCC